jgi:hypothetical protein
MGSRGTARRAVAFGAVALVALACAWWIAGHRPARENVLPSPPAAVPPFPTAPGASASAPASVAVLEKAEKMPEPTAAVEGKGEPLAKKLGDEEKRIAELEARVKEAEAAAREARAPRATPAVPEPPPPPPEVGRPGAGQPAAGQPAAPGQAVSRLLAVRERLEPGRKGAGRLSREDFQFALDEARAVLQQHPRNPDARYLVTYGRGGLAYVAGEDAQASALLVEAFTELRRTARREVRPIVGLLLRPDGTIGQPNGWELALGYGDARGEAMGLIEKELQANPRSARALRARAHLRKMRGQDEGRPN